MKKMFLIGIATIFICSGIIYFHEKKEKPFPDENIQNMWYFKK